jgi:2'-5' RNA ligase superfamily
VAQAVVLLFDADGDAAVRSVWKRFEVAGVPSPRSLTNRPHDPHVSLVVADRIERGAWTEVLRERFFAGDTLVLGLAAAAVFPGPEGWLVLAVTPTRRLIDGHAALVASLGACAEGLWDHYLPDAWVPHCTLAGGVDGDRLGWAMAAAGGALPLAVRVERAELVDSDTGAAERLLDTPSGA